MVLQIMKTKVTHQYHNCTKCKRPVLPCEEVGIVGRDNFGRDKVVCMSCKRN